MKYTKQHKPDRRYKEARELKFRFDEIEDFLFWQKWGYTICIYIIVALAGLVFGKIATELYYNRTHTPILNPKSSSEVKVQQVLAAETPCDYDPITYIRCSGEKLGEPNSHIITMIKIARAESGLRPKAKNPKSTASGIFQIIYGTWNSNNCQGNAFNFVNNIDCAWKIHQARGFQPWEVYNKGLIK